MGIGPQAPLVSRGDAAILCWSVYDDPASLLWCAALVGVGVVLFVIERVFGTKERAAA